MSFGFNITKTYRYVTVLVTALLLLLQGANLSHAASYGSDPHEHDGVECVLSQSIETHTTVPAPTKTLILPVLQSRQIVIFEVNFSDTPTRLYRGREPPPRGPPSQQN